MINSLIDILKIGDISRQDNIFDLGITSIHATIFVERAKEYFKIAMSIENLFEEQTPSEIAKLIKKLSVSKID